MTIDVFRSGSKTRTAVILAFIISAVSFLLVCRLCGIETEVIADRYWKNAVPLFEGQIPDIEYPPLALVFIAIPRLLGSTEWGYETAWVGMIVVFMVIGLLITERIAGDLKRNPTKAMIAYGVLCVAMIEFVLDRFDIIAAVFALAAIMMFVEKKYPWAFALLAMGAMIKIYPALLFPPMLFYLLINRGISETVKGLIAFIATALLIAAVSWLIDPSLITGFISYNTGRPLQIESFAASLVYAISVFGGTEVWIQPASAEAFWSDNLRGPLADSIADIMLPLAAASLILLWIVCAYFEKRSPDSPKVLAVFLSSSVLVFLIMNKVFSTQYLIWLIPPLIFLMLTWDSRTGRGVFAATIVVMLLGQIDFAYNVGISGGGTGINDAGMLIILAKNLATAFLLCLTAKNLISRPMLIGESPTVK